MHTPRFLPRRHPMCSCPDWAPTFAAAEPPEPDRSLCRGGTVAHPAPLDFADAMKLVNAVLTAGRS